MPYFIARFDEKQNLLEILRQFSKNFLRKLRKMHYFSIFFKRFNKSCFNFSRFGWETQIVGKIWENFDETSIEKLNFYFIFIFILEILLLKIEPSEITPFFLQQFFRFRGGGEFPPGYALASSPKKWHNLF